MASITKLTKAGTQKPWQVRWRDPAGQQKTKTFAKLADAQRHKRQVESTIESGTYEVTQKGKTLFRDFCELWLSMQVHLGPNTRRGIESRLRIHLLPHFGHMQLMAIDRLTIDRWVAGLRLAPGTVRLLVAQLTTILSAAVRYQYLEAKPIEGKLKMPRSVKQPLVPITDEQVWALIDNAPPEYRCLVLVAAYSGLRSGELLGLTREWVKVERHELVVNRQWLTPLDSPAGYFTPPKTDASVRTVPIPESVTAAIVEHIRRYGTSDQGHIFQRNGAPFRRGALGKLFTNTLAKAAGLPKGVSMHDLRHYYASLLIRGGCNIKQVQAALGHSSAGETWDLYGHLFPDDDERTRRAADQYMREAGAYVLGQGPKPQQPGGESAERSSATVVQLGARKAR